MTKMQLEEKALTKAVSKLIGSKFWKTQTRSSNIMQINHNEIRATGKAMTSAT